MAVTWIVKVGSEQISSDDFTLEDLIALEKETGTPWSGLNPLREAQVARAFLRIAIKRLGGKPDDADNATLKQLKHTFAFEADEPWPGGEEAAEEDSAPLDSRGPGSSPGAQDDSTGLLALPGGNA